MENGLLVYGIWYLKGDLDDVIDLNRHPIGKPTCLLVTRSELDR